MLSDTQLALEKAADLLMDHGVIRTGAELEKVCEQIRSLRLFREVVIGQLAISVSNAPRDMIVSELRGSGIPAIPNAKAYNLDFEHSIRCERGRLHYWYDGLQDVHRFRWEDVQ